MRLHLGITDVNHCSWLAEGFWGSEPTSLCLCGKHFSRGGIPLAPVSSVPAVFLKLELPWLVALFSSETSYLHLFAQSLLFLLNGHTVSSLWDKEPGPKRFLLYITLIWIT